MKSFSKWLNEEKEFGIRYVHNDGRGLMNNSSLNYDKLDDDEHSEVEEGYLGLQQPPSYLHNQQIVFVFTPEGEIKHKRLIELLVKASKRGVRREQIDLSDYKTMWDSGDGQLGLVAKTKKPVNPNVFSWAKKKFGDETKARNFAEWFGDSKVVDADGNPLVVYKAMGGYDFNLGPTRNFKGQVIKPAQPGFDKPLDVIQRPGEFPTFDKDDPKGVEIAGFFGSKEIANKFSQLPSMDSVYPVFLKMEKPYMIDAKEEPARNFQFGPTGKPFRDAIRSNQYDGVIIENTGDEGTIYVALKANQIKSATGNKGTFNLESDKINESLLEERQRSFSEWLKLDEGLNYPCIVVDVQPEYCNDIPRRFVSFSSVCEKIIKFVTKQTGPVLMFVNAETSGFSTDTIQEIKAFWEDTIGYNGENDEDYYSYDSPINWNRFEIVDKGYGHFRTWMDNEIQENIIIATIRELYQQKKYSTEDLEFDEKNLTPMQVKIKETIEDMNGDHIYINWTSVSQLKRFSGAYIMGGGRNECLREVELLMNAFNIKYKRIDSLVYGR